VVACAIKENKYCNNITGVLFYVIAAVCTCARNNHTIKLHGRGICQFAFVTWSLTYLPVYFIRLSIMTCWRNVKFVICIFLTCDSSPTRACKIVSAFILFYVIAVVHTYAMIAAFMLFYCACNHGLTVARNIRRHCI